MRQKTAWLRGVNLGGWLVLEKRMTPSVFEGLAAVDETTYCVELGAHAEQALKTYWDTFITYEDFGWLTNIDQCSSDTARPLDIRSRLSLP
jgi:glucan 1,3-beta-glucosidase